METPSWWWDISQRFHLCIWSGWQEKQGKYGDIRKRDGNVVLSLVSEVYLQLVKKIELFYWPKYRFCFINNNGVIFNFRPLSDKYKNHLLTHKCCFFTSRSTAKTCACWPSFFWTTRHYIMMWNPSYSMLWQKQTALVVTWLDIFQRSGGSGV